MFKRIGRISLLCVAVLTSCVDDPQTVPTDSEGDSKEGTELGFETNLSDDIAAYKSVVNIIRETGLAQNFVILPGDVKNVKAYIENNERILEYNPLFMEKLQGDTNWHGISVLAREIGHHLSNHKLEGENTVEEELEADKYAGFVLFKMGASLDEAIKAMESIAKEDSIGGKASLNSRIVSLTKGWNNAKVLMTDTSMLAAQDTTPTVAPSSAVADSKPKTTKKEKPEYLYRVFLAIDSKIYFVDENDMIIYEEKGKPKEVGLKKDSNKPGFDWIFVKEGDSYGVDLKGRLWAFSTDGTFHVVGQAFKLNVQ